MSVVTYHAIRCELDPEEESSFEPTASEARATAIREGWHFRRLGGERWYCPDHEAEWRADKPKHDEDTHAPS